MESKKNNFKGYQNEKITQRVQLIQEQIAIYNKKKVKFKNITEMAETLSAYITKQEGKSCSSSTLLRNEKYKKLIEEYFYSQEGVNRTGEVSKLISDLTLSNTERENYRLKQYILILEKQLEDIKNTGINNANILENKDTYLSNEESSSANLKKALNLLITHFEGLVAINENGDLIDLTKKD